MLVCFAFGKWGLVIRPPQHDHAHPLHALFQAPRNADTVVRTSDTTCTEAIRVPASVETYRLEIDGRDYDVLVGAVVVADTETEADTVLTTPPAQWDDIRLSGVTQPQKLPRRKLPVYARCTPSMLWLDGVVRAYVTKRHTFKKKSIAIRAVAGSGKTTTLLDLAKRYKRECNGKSTKPILYIAFNKQLVDEMRTKVRAQGLTDVMVPMTFDALVKRVGQARAEAAGECFDFVGALNPTELARRYPWFATKGFRVKKATINDFAAFCQDPKATVPVKKMTQQLWGDTLLGTLNTFDGLRKRAHHEHWMKDHIDQKYARVFVDEAQDFDPIMLDILLHDTTVPKVYVGDPRQQIYEWRGTINAFERLPPDDTLVFEYYKTFRMGDPATSVIAKRTRTPLVSGVPARDTRIAFDVTDDDIYPHNAPNDKAPHNAPTNNPTRYTYLFRTWRELFTAAKRLSERLPTSATLFVHNFDKQMEMMERLHANLQTLGNKASTDACGADDDLPYFLMQLSADELAALKTCITSRRARRAEDAHCEMYTVHGFKGREADVVRVCGDVDPVEEANLYYVAVTRGRQQVWVDKSLPSATPHHQEEATASATTSTNAKGRRSPPKARVNLDDHPNPLVHALRTYRTDTARAEDIQAYQIMTNQTLCDVAEAMPRDVHALRRVKGMGEKRVARFGVGIVGVVVGL